MSNQDKLAELKNLLKEAEKKFTLLVFKVDETRISQNKLLQVKDEILEELRPQLDRWPNNPELVLVPHFIYNTIQLKDNSDTRLKFTAKRDKAWEEVLRLRKEIQDLQK